MKSVMQGRIGEAEGRLGQLRSWQEELEDELHASVQDELYRIKSALESSAGTQELPTSIESKPLSIINTVAVNKVNIPFLFP